MSRLILLTSSAENPRSHQGSQYRATTGSRTASSISNEILPSLALLHHDVRVMPAEASALIEPFECDAVLLDARKDLVSAKSLTSLIATTGIDVPLIVITGEGSFTALSSQWGFDEIILDTASPAEVEARIRIAMERNASHENESAGKKEIRNGEITIDESTYTARIKGRPLDLTYKEFELVKFLAQHPGRVFTRSQLLQEIWGYDYYGGTRTVDVHIRRLRSKLGPENESMIGTVRNDGYRFTVPNSSHHSTSEEFSDEELANDHYML
jgi:DNA-binding response OmpR family regulator